GGADVLSTLGAVRALGVSAERDGDVVRVHGRGAGLAPPGAVVLDCGNSGTTMRLGAGVGAGGGGTGGPHREAAPGGRRVGRGGVRRRGRGARADRTEGPGRSPGGGGRLGGFGGGRRVASARVKPAVLPAGPRARGTTGVREPLASRDHTERLLGHF